MLAQAHAPERVVGILLEDQVDAVLGGLDVLLEVGVVDLVLHAQRHLLNFFYRETRETVKVRGVVP